MKSTIFLGLFLVLALGSCNPGPSSSDPQSTNAKPSQRSSEGSENVEAGDQDVEPVESTDVASNIQFIQEKYKMINQSKDDYKVVPFQTQCDFRSSAELERWYNSKDELAYLKYASCGGHGCRSKEHYYWEGELIFIFQVNDDTPGSSHLIEEHRTYIKDGKMIRCLEKTARYYEGQPPMAELLKKAENKEVDCSPEKLTENLSFLEGLSPAEAQEYFCPSSKMLGTFESIDCSKNFDTESFSCECAFSTDGGNKDPLLFVSNMGKHACVKIKEQLNALYPDWEERDYKAELKKLSNASPWLSSDGNNINYFGKPLSHYKYVSGVEFLTDVILASGKDINSLATQITAAAENSKPIKAEVQAAVAKAKNYLAKGGSDPLTIVKYDNRSYDVFVRYRRTTQYEGEANSFEGQITLLKNRGTEILETRELKGTCGC